MRFVVAEQKSVFNCGPVCNQYPMIEEELSGPRLDFRLNEKAAHDSAVKNNLPEQRRILAEKARATEATRAAVLGDACYDEAY